MGLADGFGVSGWSLSLYPGAGEAGGCLVSPYARTHSVVPRGRARDPQRVAAEAGRRARGKLRRYCTANQLNRMGTLTYEGEGCHDPRQVRADVASFFRSLREGSGGRAFPYVWVPEWHHTEHGLHLHYAVGRYVKRSLIEAAWGWGVVPGRGFVHIKLLGDLPVGSGPRAEARQAAGYLSKYVAKTFADPGARVLGLHRYDVAQGFQPERQTLTGRTVDEVLDQACQVMDGEPRRVWWSGDEPTWDRPPAVWAQWA